MEYVNCNLCGGDDSAPVFVLPDYLLGRSDVAATIVRCKSCGLLYQNPRPTLAEMAHYYPPEYELYVPESKIRETSRLLERAVQYGIRKRMGYVTRYKHSGRLLDVGCASGVFLGGMQKAGGWELYGVEINPDAARMAREQCHIDVRTGTLEQAAFASGFFDAITLWDVLEHLHDPAATLREIHRVLKRGGVLVIRVPNAASWDARLFGRYWAGLEPPRHLYVFTPDTLRALVTANGLSPQVWSSRMAAYTTFLLSLRFWINDHKSSSGARGLAWLDHPVMRLLSAPLFYVGSLGLRGPLMVVVARKDAATT